MYICETDVTILTIVPWFGQLCLVYLIKLFPTQSMLTNCLLSYCLLCYVSQVN